MRSLIFLTVLGALAVPATADYIPALDETFVIGSFYLDPLETESTTYEIAEQGNTVVGFSVAFDYDELPQEDSSWASDLLLEIVGPSGSSFLMGGDATASDLRWDFHGSASDEPGYYEQSPVLADDDGNPAFNSNGMGGTSEGGTWTFYLTDDWFSANEVQNVYTDVTITLHKVPEPASVSLLCLGMGLLAVRRR